VIRYQNSRKRNHNILASYHVLLPPPFLLRLPHNLPPGYPSTGKPRKVIVLFEPKEGIIIGYNITYIHREYHPLRLQDKVLIEDRHAALRTSCFIADKHRLVQLAISYTHEATPNAHKYT
jgi:hypothetical protein